MPVYSEGRWVAISQSHCAVRVGKCCLNEVGRGGLVAVDVVRGGAGAGVAGLDGGRHVVVDGDGEVGERGDGRFDRIGEKLSAGRDGDVGVSSECEGAVAGWVDGGRCGRDGVSHVDRGEVEGGGSEGVGDVDAEGCAPC